MGASILKLVVFHSRTVVDSQSSLSATKDENYALYQTVLFWYVRTFFRFLFHKFNHLQPWHSQLPSQSAVLD